jgi:hypothetical protein
MSFYQSNIVLSSHGTTVDEIHENLIKQLKTCARFSKNINIQILIVDPKTMHEPLNIDIEYVKKSIGATHLNLEKIEYR